MTSSKHDLGFVNTNTITLALAQNIHAADLANTITVYDPNPECLRSFCTEIDAINVHDNGSVALTAPILFLAVKPQDIENATSTLAIKNKSLTDKLVVSIAAGVTLDRLSSWLPDARLIRVMPNTPCLVSEMAAGKLPILLNVFLALTPRSPWKKQLPWKTLTQLWTTPRADC